MKTILGKPLSFWNKHEDIYVTSSRQNIVLLGAIIFTEREELSFCHKLMFSNSYFAANPRPNLKKLTTGLNLRPGFTMVGFT